jgi:hypothetical protein
MDPWLSRFRRNAQYVLTGWRTPEPTVWPHASGYTNGKYLQQVWVAPDLTLVPTTSVLMGLGTIDVSGISDMPELTTALRIDTVTTAECQRYLMDALSMPAIEQVRQNAIGEAIYRLDLAVTEMDPGESFLRQPLYLVFGIGVAWLQVEGMVTEDRSGGVLFRFVERRRHVDTFNLAWWRGLARGEFRGSAVGYMKIRELAESIGLDVLREIKEALSSPPLSQPGRNVRTN